MNTSQTDSDNASDDIFDPEIIYCVTKVTIEPFITCIFDKDKYEKGNDYTIAYLESVENRYLCVAFGEELTPSHIGSTKNIIVKKSNHHVMGTILVVGYKGGTILLNNPLTNISTMYYAYINSLTESPSFKKVVLIPETEKHSLESQKDKIYISNVDTVVYKPVDGIPIIEIERIPVGSWFPTKEIYPKRVPVKGWKEPPPRSPLRIKIDEDISVPEFIKSWSNSSTTQPEFLTNSLPSINEETETVKDIEIVEVIVHRSPPQPPTPRPISVSISVLPKTTRSDLTEDEPVRCCCVKYFLIPLYEWFVTKLKSLESKPSIHPIANQSNNELP